MIKKMVGTYMKESMTNKILVCVSMFIQLHQMTIKFLQTMLTTVNKLNLSCCTGVKRLGFADVRFLKQVVRIQLATSHRLQPHTHQRLNVL